MMKLPVCPLLVSIIVMALALSACRQTPPPPTDAPAPLLAESFTLSSLACDRGGTIPVKYSCNGDNTAPNFDALPDKAACRALYGGIFWRKVNWWEPWGVKTLEVRDWNRTYAVQEKTFQDAEF